MTKFFKILRLSKNEVVLQKVGVPVYVRSGYIVFHGLNFFTIERFQLLIWDFLPW